MIQQILKQAFPPALRLWFLRTALSSPEEVLAFQPLIQELLLEQEIKPEPSVPDLSQVFTRWVLEGQWDDLVQGVEILFQFLPGEKKETVLTVLEEQWPKELVFSPQGFLYYKEKPVLKYLAEGTLLEETGAVADFEPAVLSVSVEDSRKETFQKIRQQRLRLLKNWESI